MEFSRQEYWNGLPFSTPGDPPNPGIEPGSPVSCNGRQILYDCASWCDYPLFMQVSRDLFKVIQLLNSEPGLRARFQNLGQPDTKPETLPLSNPRWCYRYSVMIDLAQLVEESVCTLNSSHLSWGLWGGLVFFSSPQAIYQQILYFINCKLFYYSMYH